ncbi:MAG: motility associated factor glycosyltransferase family protein [Spirochaetes bacterium]|nr:motility associated factor glycosyltransferase family protein [Spirochaetota bacterium]
MSQYVLKETPGGKLTLIYRNSRDVRLHSAYEPDLEAGRAVDGFSAGRATVIVVSGVALGYHIECLRQKFPGKTIIAVERDAEVVALVRENCPQHLSGVAVVSSTADLPAALEGIDMAGFRGMAHYPHRPSYQLYREFYDSVFRDMGQYMSSKISDLLTRFEFEERWVENILKNIHHLFTSGSVISLFGRFAGVPGVIVSAGPSLRKNAGILGEMRGRALIVAVDTAARVLGRIGIEPHIIMTLDSQKYSMKHFLGLRGGGAALLADLVSYPAVARSYRGRRIMSTTSKYYSDTGGELKRETTPLMDWIEKYIRPVGDIQSGGSVATSAFDLLLNLGCSPIILVGQDLAYTGREIHCSGTYHNDEWLPRVSRLSNLDTINQGVIRKRKIKHVAAYGGRGTVISDFVFDLYRGWFEDSARKVSVPVINATEGGARIQATEERTLESVCGGCRTLNPSPADIVERALSGVKPDRPDRLAGAMKRAVEQLGGLRDLAVKALDHRDLAPAVEEMINGDDIRFILQPFMRKSRTFLARYDKSPEEAERLVLTDIRSATARLIPAIEESLRRLGAP